MMRDSVRELGIEMSVWEPSPAGLGQRSDGANLVVYVASGASRYVNGAEIVIDNALVVQ